MHIEGRCHCGNLSFELESGRTLEELGPRECACSFCRAQAAKCVSDPAGRASVTVRDAGKLIRYRFGLANADFLICGSCGVYLGALMQDQGEVFATLNLRATALHDVPGAPVSYDGEEAPARRTRRRDRWTPTEVHGVDLGAPDQTLRASRDS